jgi:hypothetical protein
MKQLSLLLLIVVMTAACSSQRNSEAYILTAKERSMCDSLQIDQAVVQEIRSFYNNEIEPFHYSLGKIIEKDKEIEADPIFLKGFVLQEKNSESYNLVFALKEKLANKGYSIFLLENNFNINNKLDHIGVLKTSDKYSVLKQIRTDGINFDITNDSLITIIKKFDENYSLELIGASGDWCEFVIHKEPSKWMEFANEVYKVCPDVVDQGTGTTEALAEEMKRTKRLYFWWD